MAFSGGSTITCGYRSDGLRAWKQTSAGRTYYFYDGTMPILEVGSDYNDTNNRDIRLIANYGPDGLLRTYNIGTLNANAGVDGFAYYLYDPTGNPAHAMSSAGFMLFDYQFSAWGETHTALAISATADGSPAYDPMSGYKSQFGYYADAETGLSLAGHRYYDPQAGRWLTRDPIGYDGGINLYAYCDNNPVMGVDPTGLAHSDLSMMGQFALGEVKGLAGSAFDLFHAASDPEFAQRPQRPDFIRALLSSDGGSEYERNGNAFGGGLGFVASLVNPSGEKKAATYITYTIRDFEDSEKVLYVGRASGIGTADRVLAKRFSNHEYANAGVRTLDGIQKSSAANKGAEWALY